MIMGVFLHYVLMPAVCMWCIHHVLLSGPPVHEEDFGVFSSQALVSLKSWDSYPKPMSQGC